jgi:hypothetical protein
MKSRAIKAGLIALEALGVVVAIIIALALFLSWRVQSGPISLDVAMPALRTAVNAAWLDGAVRTIDHAELSRADQAGGYRLTFEGVAFGDRQAPATVRVPSIVADFHPSDILQGRAGPRRILVEGAEARIVRRKDRRLKLDLGEGASERVAGFRALTGGEYFRKAFERAELANAAIYFVDEASGRRWVGRNANAVVVRSDAGYDARISGVFDVGARPAKLDFSARYDLKDDVIAADLKLQRAPVGDLIAIFFNEQSKLLTSLISGEATIRVKSDGSVIASRMKGVAEGGDLNLGVFSSAIERIDIDAAFDPRVDQFDVTQILWRTAATSGRLSGRVRVVPKADGGGVASVEFETHANGVSLNPRGVFPEPLDIARAEAVGRYDVDGRSIAFQSLDLGLEKLRLSGALTVSAGGPLKVRSDIAIDGAMAPNDLLALWPTELALGAREFVRQRIDGAVFSNVAVRTRIDEGAHPGAPLRNDELAISFDLANARVVFTPGLKPLEGVNGRGLLQGNAFRFDAKTATVGGVLIERGLVDIPVMVPKGQMARFTFRADGDASQMLAVLNDEPLALLKESGFKPSQFSGRAIADVEIQRPNLRVASPQAYRYAGRATFSSLGVESIFNDLSLERASGEMTLDSEGIVVKAKAVAGDTPLDINWSQKFRGLKDKSKIVLKGIADSATGDLFGIASRRFLQGPIAFNSTIVGDLGKFSRVDISADFSNATLAADGLGWMKPKGARADGEFSIAWREDGARDINVSMLGAGLDLRGRMTLAKSGLLLTANADSIKLIDAVDMTLDAKRSNDGALDLAIDGAFLNAAPMIERFLGEGLSSDGAAQSRMTLNARFDRVHLRGAAQLSDASIEFEKTGARYNAFDFRATDARAAPVVIALDNGQGSGAQTVIARSSDIGALLEGVFAISSVKGGEGVLEFKVSPGDSAAAHGPEGTLHARNLRVVDAPLLAKIFGASSLTGLADILNGDGIALERTYAKFALDDGRMTIAEARATGPSIGMTASGVVALGRDGEVDLEGAVAPAYGLNSFLGKTPLIGPLFVNRKGEGLLAISYDVDGSIGEPRVTVNPLSALTPGVLRRMFEDDSHE